MRQQVERFSPHQNGKVFGILMAIGSLIFLVPFFLLASAFGPDETGAPFWMALLFPLIYLVLGYLSVALGCWLYNVMFPYIGGIEFQAKER